MAKFEQQLRRDPQSYSLAAGAGKGRLAKGKNSRKAAKVCSLFPAFSPLAEPAIEQAKIMAYLPLWRRTTALAAAGAFFLMAGGGWRVEGTEKKSKVRRWRLVSSGEHVIIAAASVAAFYDLPASCRLAADVDGRGVPARPGLIIPASLRNMNGAKMLSRQPVFWIIPASHVNSRRVRG
jgi:hypothetical protein